ncbi:MAG: HD domain-containing protein [Thermoleophilia bacterium]|nr:HD domain-containing protein [Thermoleophilia bacterium]
MTTLEPGRMLDGVFAVRRKERRISRKGAPYLALTLGDASGAISAVIFDEADWFAGQFEEGDRVRVAGEVTSRGGRSVLRVRSLRPAEAADNDVDLLPRSHRDPDDMFGFVLGLADEVVDVGLRAVLDAMTGDQGLAEQWRTVPCTRSGHHAYLGGLVEHSVGVAMLCQSLCTWHPRVDSDLLVTAALLHDIGYVRCFTVGPATVDQTEEGRLLGHVPIGQQMVGEIAHTVGLSDERRLALLHVIGWHHGPPAGAHISQASAEAVALWRANAMESGVKARLEGVSALDDTSISI